MDKDSYVITMLREARENSGITQKEIETKTGLPQSFISNIEKGKRYISLELLIKLGEAIGLNPADVAEAWKKDKIAELDVEVNKHVKIA